MIKAKSKPLLTITFCLGGIVSGFFIWRFICHEISVNMFPECQYKYQACTDVQQFNEKLVIFVANVFIILFYLILLYLFQKQKTIKMSDNIRRATTSFLGGGISLIVVFAIFIFGTLFH